MNAFGRGFAWVWFGLLRVALLLLPVVVLVFVLVIVHALATQARWQFTVSALSEVVTLELPMDLETNWRVDGAILCTGSNAPRPDNGTMVSQSMQGQAVCAGRLWSAFALPEPEGARPGFGEEWVLRLGGDPRSMSDSPIRVIMEVLPTQDLVIAVRGANAGDRLGVLHTVGSNFDHELFSPVNLVWLRKRATAIPPVLVFPFSGDLVAGRDVNWADPRMLRSGSLSVFTSSQEAASKRVLVEQMDLMLGDSIGLRALTGKDETTVSLPRGHLRFASRAVADEGPVLELAATGLAESLSIDRFGQAGLEFRPGWWARLVHDKVLLVISIVLAGLLTMLGAYAEAITLAPRVEDRRIGSKCDPWVSLGAWFRRLCSPSA